MDLAGIGVAFTGCSAVGNQAGGFQVKPANTALAWKDTIGYLQYSLVSYPQPEPTQTYRNKVSIAAPVPPAVLPPPPSDTTRWEVFQPNAASAISFIGCRVEDDWSGNGFAVVNAIAEGVGGGTPVPPPQNISYLGCSAVRNFSSGFAFTTDTIIGVLMANCVSRSNLKSGVTMQQFCRNVKLINCQLHGNGTIATANTSWNLVIHAASGVRVDNCSLQGTDPVDQNLTTNAAIDTANARCGGAFITLTQPNYQLSDVVFSGLRVKNHIDGINVDYRGTNPSDRGSFIDVANLCTMEYGADGFVASLKAGATLPVNSRVKLDNLGQVVLATSGDRAIGEVLGGNGGSFVDVRIAGVRQGKAATVLSGGSLKSGDLVYPAADGTWSNSGSVAVGQVLLNAGAVVLPGGLFSYLTYI